MSERGRFVVFEGIDGSGSTSQAGAFASYLRQKGKKVTYTHEPSGGPVGSIIRLALEGRIVGAPTSEPQGRLDERTMALLYAADRSDHTKVVIEPSLKAGRTVVCDRYLISSLAYQSNEFSFEWLLSINEDAITPDITVYLDVPVQRAMTRMSRSRWKRDMYEDEARLAGVLESYKLAIARRLPQVGRVAIVDATQRKEVVMREIRSIVLEAFGTSANDNPQVGQLFDVVSDSHW